MRYEDILERISETARVPSEDAARAVRAVLLTLSERAGPKESADLAAQLPKELKDAFRPGTIAERFDAAEFTRRVAERLEADPSEVRALERAAFLALHEAVSHGELEDIEAALSTDYVDLAARHADVGGNPRTVPPDSHHRGEVAVSAPEFLERVAERAGLDEERARRATEAVLETFGERIAAGEAKDLAQQLPEPAAEPLLRPGGDAKPMPADEFVHRIGEREGEIDPIAREHARAVLSTVREAVTVDEWDDTMSELPREYDELLV